MLEPYKVGEGEHVRGIPTLHDELSKWLDSINLLDCTKHTEDPLCKHEHFSENEMLGSGHHVRTKTAHPVIGILAQPIPDERFQKSILKEEFDRIEKE